MVMNPDESIIAWCWNNHNRLKRVETSAAEVNGKYQRIGSFSELNAFLEKCRKAAGANI
jgi:hypothetical protein